MKHGNVYSVTTAAHKHNAYVEQYRARITSRTRLHLRAPFMRASPQSSRRHTEVLPASLGGRSLSKMVNTVGRGTKYKLDLLSRGYY